MSQRNTSIRQAMFALSCTGLSDIGASEYIDNFSKYSGIKDQRHLSNYVTDCRISYCSAHSKRLIIKHGKRLGDSVVDAVCEWEQAFIDGKPSGHILDKECYNEK
ncbi:hypothetical protein COPG_00103 [Colwellia phage 9A]|uniref:Uncharacterized protein n=1 Tax=Colwellia phage 9A TaxID=765765 RepID=I3UMI4_9CAUD|nr:hypothetical protein COPG_00103 [Colwellia phage 9A]AFK66699.1 hypothetical protein COPG_00103 [Colwellia phage 9A]